MKGKTVVITGGNDGIGFQTALELARKDAELILVCRNEQKAEAAVERIKSSTGNSNVKYVLGDMSKQKSVRQAAEQIRKITDKIDVLLNNAGGAFPEFQLTEDSLELTIATNHFAYFLLTGLLLDLVKKSDYARIVNVSSDSHYRAKISIESFKSKKGYFVLKAYGQSKLANVLFTFELAEKLKGTPITVNCLHPGTVKTDIGKKGTSWYGTLVWSIASSVLGVSLEKGSRTSIYLASSEEVNGVSGKYFTNCKIKEPLKLAYDTSLRKKLWDVSEKYSGFSYKL